MTSSPATSTDIPPGAGECATRERFEGWLPSVVAHPPLHAQFIHTLSMLEHIGSVRIARTQSGMGASADVLEHLAEETRHAHYLKRLAFKIDPDLAQEYAEDQLLAGAAARTYFARLDACSRSFVRAHTSPDIHSAATYLLVSWLVERRAMWLYPAYQELLRGANSSLSVRSIINDETGHLEEMTEGLAQLGLLEHPDLPAMVECEEGLFGRLADAMIAAAEPQLQTTV